MNYRKSIRNVGCSTSQPAIIAFMGKQIRRPIIFTGKIGWGGRIRTFTVLINSEVSYQLDHAPVVGQNTIDLKDLVHMRDFR